MLQKNRFTIPMIDGPGAWRFGFKHQFPKGLPDGISFFPVEDVEDEIAILAWLYEPCAFQHLQMLQGIGDAGGCLHGHLFDGLFTIDEWDCGTVDVAEGFGKDTAKNSPTRKSP
jgi:hypothetical protein